MKQYLNTFKIITIQTNGIFFPPFFPGKAQISIPQKLCFLFLFYNNDRIIFQALNVNKKELKNRMLFLFLAENDIFLA